MKEQELTESIRDLVLETAFVLPILAWILDRQDLGATKKVPLLLTATVDNLCMKNMVLGR